MAEQRIRKQRKKSKELESLLEFTHCVNYSEVFDMSLNTLYTWHAPRV